MVKWILLALGWFPLLSFGQIASSDDHGALLSHVHRLTDSATDAEKESASFAISSELQTLLNAAHAFEDPFSDVPISRVDAADGKFRLFTWNFALADGSYHYDGVMLVRDGERSGTIMLHDATNSISNPAIAQLTAAKWYGALYYGVVPVKKGAKTFYTLLGWKGFSKVETRKVMEVLSFNGTTPRFGAPIFGTGRAQHQREIFAFTALASMHLKWEPSRNAIVLDHLAPTTPEFEGQAAFTAPDLSYDAYVWDKRGWEFQRDIDMRQTGRAKPYKAPPKNP